MHYLGTSKIIIPEVSEKFFLIIVLMWAINRKKKFLGLYRQNPTIKIDKL